MNNTCIFVHFAKEVLTVDQLQWPAPEGVEVESEPFELAFSDISDRANHFAIRETVSVFETFANAVACPRTCNYKLHLREIDHLTVVQIDCELKSEKIT
jgi:hypothetical protein